MNTSFIDKGCVGLANLGNTCFLNSCIQVLNHIYELSPIMINKIKKGQTNNCDDTILLEEWNELHLLMWKENGIISPNKFIYNVQQIARRKNKDIFTGWAQNDLSEFLLFLIDCFHNSLSRKVGFQINGTSQNKTDEIAITTFKFLKTIYENEYSEIMDLFYGVYLTTIMSADKSTTHSIKPEHFFTLDLQIFEGNHQCQTLYDCFDLFVKPEEMIDDNAWFNEKTGKKEDIKKTMTFWSLPKILVIILKRFSPDGSRKIQTNIEFPLKNLNLSKYIQGYKPESYKYDLFGVCNHMGGVNGGHYTSYVKNMENQWIHFNDTNVEKIKGSEIISPKAYCLFYRKK